MWDEEEPAAEEKPAPPNPDAFVRSALIFYGVLGCAALLWRMAPTPGDSILYPVMGGADAAFSGTTSLGIGVFVGLLTIAAGELLTEYTNLGEGLADLVGETLAGVRVPEAILLALASGLAEEMLFRGALQPTVGLVWASVIFGVCHFVPRRDLILWSVYAVVMGFVFGLLFEWTGHLAAPVAAHTVVNAVNLPRLAKRFEEKQAETSSERNASDDDWT